MSTRDPKAAPTPVIRRSRRKPRPAHGGVWKIAYADFITALMAFFLLMWTLTVTKSGDLIGVSAALQSPIRSEATAKGSASGEASSLVRAASEGKSRRRSDGSPAAATPESAAAAESTEVMRERIESPLRSDPALERFAGRIFMDRTAEGLRVQIVDENNRSMFQSGSADMSAATRSLLQTIGRVLADMDTLMRIEGHTDARPFSGRPDGYGNWELSSERANAARREIVAGGYEAARVVSVTGFADTVRLNETNPDDPLNRRISLLIMRRPDPNASSVSSTGTGPAVGSSGASMGGAQAGQAGRVRPPAWTDPVSIDLQPRMPRPPEASAPAANPGQQLDLTGRR